MRPIADKLTIHADKLTLTGEPLYKGELVNEPISTKRRFSIDIPEELYIKFINHTPWGMRGKVLVLMIDDFVSMMEEFGADKVIGAFVERAVKMEDITKVKIGGKNE